MHRARRLFAVLSLAAASIWSCNQATADLIRPNPPQTYPDVAANLGDGVGYNYNSKNLRGVFTLKNTAYVLSAGPGSKNEYDINPDSNGQRYQLLSLVLDKNGNFTADPANKYELYGSVTANGQSFSGLLLSGAPTAFGWTQVTGSDGSKTSLFQADLKITDGQLASFFGANPYIHLVAETGDTFHGKFDENFSIAKVSSNTHALDTINPPFPVPEPTVILILAAGSCGLICRRKLHRVP